jgi:hypothetical protein
MATVSANRLVACDALISSPYRKLGSRRCTAARRTASWIIYQWPNGGKKFEADLIATMNEDAIGEYNDLLHRPATKLKEQLAELKQKKKMEERQRRYDQSY